MRELSFMHFEWLVHSITACFNLSDSLTLQVHNILCIFFVFVANVSVSISFERLYFRFYINSVSKITIVFVSVTEVSLVYWGLVSLGCVMSWCICRWGCVTHRVTWFYDVDRWVDGLVVTSSEFDIHCSNPPTRSFYTQKRVSQRYERCSRCSFGGSSCCQIFDLLKLFHYTADRRETSHTDWWQYCPHSHRDAFSS